ncbi:hypothetical protein B9Z55_027299 [Caenorhabditis nigoni]|uniref:Uncharacterized protein n=1 Tax=Caenorhabditis nigoni TaxID=1611254 RepID=A0A2G5SFV3_9PELO|nr:hypothetical protein B9Z55_027299 [Caenorhabditis nigoni]
MKLLKANHKETGQEKDAQEKSDEIIKLKHEIIQRMRDVVSLNDKYVAEQVIAAKNELLAIRNEKKQELLEELELIDLKYVFDSLRIDLAAHMEESALDLTWEMDQAAQAAPNPKSGQLARTMRIRQRNLGNTCCSSGL